MSNPNFVAVTSTNEIYRDLNEERCLTDDLDTIESDIDALEESVADLSSDKAAAVHTHAQGDVTGLASALAGKSDTTHTHTDKADLVGGKVPESQLPSYVDDVIDGTLVNTTTFNDVDGASVTPESGKIYNDTTENKSYRWSGTQFVEIGGGVALGETAATAHRGDHGKTAYDHSQDGTVHVTAAQKTAWDGKAEGDHAHGQGDITGLAGALAAKMNANPTVVTTTGENLDNYLTAGVWSFPQAYTPTNIPAGTNGWLVVIPWGDGLGTVKQFWLRHGTLGDTDHEVYTRTRIAALAAWSEWSKFYSTQNPPTADEVGAIAKALLFTNDTGGVEYSLGASSGKNTLNVISEMPQGVHTMYAITGTPGNPRTTESFRFLIHKTSDIIGWILAWDAQGSLFTNYQSNAGTFKGWKCIYDASPASMILWSGVAYMQSVNSNPQTITPSKKLSECRTGWLLLWSDYDANTNTANDNDFCTTFIPKFNPAGGTWGGKAFLCSLPTYVGGDPDDIGTEIRVIKPIYVHDDCLKGSYQNTSGGRNDVVLRAVYEI